LLIGAPLPPPYGGVARYIQLVVPVLLSRGYRVRIVHPGRGPAPDVSGLDGDVENVVVEHPGIARLTLWLLRRPGTLATLVRWYAKPLLRVPGYATRELGMSAALVRSAEGLLRNERPVIVHGFDTPWSYGAATVLAARERGGRTMFSFFGDVLPHTSELEHLDSKSKPFVGVSRAVLEQVDLAASMTNHCRELVRHVGLSPEDVALVRVIGDMEPFEAAGGREDVRARHGDGPLLLFVGQLRARKGPHLLVEALPEIRRGNPDARAVFVGPDYGLQSELLMRAKRFGVDDAVDLVGAVDDADLPSYYAAADVFVFPTTTTIECLGLSFVQAMFAGVPVVATKIAGAPEVIRDGIDGKLVEPGDASQLASGVGHVLSLPEHARRALGQRGRERARELFEKQAVLDDLLRAYESLLARD
jgi:glycosyltransferase involved in cell wall biosynthesis